MPTSEHRRLEEARTGSVGWKKKCGPNLSDRQWPRSAGGQMRSTKFLVVAIVVTNAAALVGCAGYIPHDTSSLLIPRLHRSEVVGFVAGLGTTFAVQIPVAKGE